MSATLTIRIDESTKAALDEIAQGAHRSKSSIAAAALEAYIRRRKWLQEKIVQADASGVLSDSEAEALFAELEQEIDGAD
ncbi:MAG: ribbon-helix-helix domain-containing protein [Pseudomonadota bacterium]|nr:ribbon-helix-helix domain-containing protein [Pseudomonadota bacterium]MDP1906281.1 ribbon-helix-helix domain-containing protein [Pseudomonadota bacterium]MDP2351648.1 ribbon-helix-helix domain-containing protein [Pseudomonadota bacterium]